MNIHLQIDRENDQIYLAFQSPGDEAKAVVSTTVEVAPDVHADFDAAGCLVGIDIGNVSAVLPNGDLSVVSIDQLVGVKEAASIVGVKKSNFIRDFANKSGFPSPVVELASGRIWLRSQVEAYTDRRDPRSSSADSSVGTAPLAAMLTRDEIAFRHVALRHLGFLLGRQEQPPTVEEIALESLREDQELLKRIRGGGQDEFLLAAERLYRKYEAASRSLLRSLLGGNDAEYADKLFKHAWSLGLREAQLVDDPLAQMGTFTRWLLSLFLQTLESYQFPVTERTRAQLAEEFDPIEAVVTLERFQKAEDEYARMQQRIRAERLVVDYLDSLSRDEIVEFFGPQVSHRAVERARTRLRRLSQESASRALPGTATG